jgi:hypothetical protein
MNVCDNCNLEKQKIHISQANQDIKPKEGEVLNIYKHNSDVSVGCCIPKAPAL